MKIKKNIKNKKMCIVYTFLGCFPNVCNALQGFLVYTFGLHLVYTGLHLNKIAK
jgi:hypothetical protein